MRHNFSMWKDVENQKQCQSVIGLLSGKPVRWLTGFQPVTSFYRVILCMRGTSHGPVSVCLSVCLSVTSRCSTKTAKRRIT